VWCMSSERVPAAAPDSSAACQALAAMGYPCPEDHFASSAWASVIQGFDVAAEVPASVEGEVVFPVSLARLACTEGAHLLVVAPETLIDTFEAQACSWAAKVGVRTAVVGRDHRWPLEARCLVGSPAAWLALCTSSGLHTLSFTGDILLVVVRADLLLAADGALLRGALERLPQPQQAIIVVHAWTPASSKFAGEVLVEPVSTCVALPRYPPQRDEAREAQPTQPAPQPPQPLPDEGHLSDSSPTKRSPPPQSTPQLQLCSPPVSEMRDDQLLSASCAVPASGEPPPGNEAQDGLALCERLEDSVELQMLSKYLSNIVVRSRDPEFRDHVSSLLPPVQKKTSVADDRTAGTAPLHGTADEGERVRIQDGIAALLAAHHASQVARAPRKGVKRVRREARVLSCAQVREASAASGSSGSGSESE